MYLQEEYLKRHGITDVPIINHVTNGSLLLKIDPGYLLMTIAWADNNRHPGNYLINHYTPIHNGYVNGFYFNKIVDECEIEWDGYYSYILNWSKGHINPILDSKELILSAWEIFVFIFDGKLANLIPNAVLDRLIYKSLDEDLTMDQRFYGYQECLTYMSIEFPFILKAFKYNLLPHVQNYCYWLAKLTKDA